MGWEGGETTGGLDFHRICGGTTPFTTMAEAMREHAPLPSGVQQKRAARQGRCEGARKKALEGRAATETTRLRQAGEDGRQKGAAPTHLGSRPVAVALRRRSALLGPLARDLTAAGPGR